MLAKNCLILAALVPFFSFGQTLTIRSAEDQKPISGAAIWCKPAPGKKDKMLFTGKDGTVSITIFWRENGPFSVVISAYGHQRKTDTISTAEDRIIVLKTAVNQLSEVVVTAQYAPGTAENSVQKVRVIGEEKIQAMGAVNLRDVLSNELNIRLSQDNILGSSMSLQGISGQNIKILIDGNPVNGRQNGNIDISQLNLNNVERIEIIEGPLSVQYGTDALGGTINLITKKKQRQTFSADATAFYESNGQYNSTGRIGYRMNKSSISFAGGRNYFDGWLPGEAAFSPEKSRPADSLRFKTWKPKEQWFGTLNYTQDVGKLKLNYTGDYFFEKITNRGYPLPPYKESAFDDYYRTTRFTNGINVSGHVGKHRYINGLISYNHYRRVKNTYYKDLTTLNENLTANGGDQDTSTFNNLVARGSISTNNDSSSINYELGFDVNHETGLGVRIKNSRQEIGDYAIFSTAEYKPFRGFVARPGLRLAYNTSYQAPVVPSLNLKYSDSLGGKSAYNLRFSYARGFRAPALKELYFFFVDLNHNITGNENLKAEYSHNFNASASVTTQISKLQYKIDVSVFYNTIENMISLAQSTGTLYSYFNVDRYKTQGIQLNNDFTLSPFRFSVGGLYMGRYNEIAENPAMTGFTWAPEGRCNVSYEWEKQNLIVSLFYKYTGKTPGFGADASGNVYRTEIQDYSMADASVSKPFFKKRILLTLGSHNLFDVRNIRGVSTGEAHSASGSSMAVAMGRTYFFKLDINLTASPQPSPMEREQSTWK